MGIACFFLICSIVHALGTLIEQRKPHHAYASLGSCRGCSVTSRGATPSSSPQLPLVWVKDNLFSVNCQHLCSIVQPQFRHFSFPSPHPSSRFSFWPRLTEFWPGWDDVLRISTIYPYQSISIIPKQSQYVSNILKYFCPGVDCGNLPSPCFHPRPQSSPSCLWHHDSRPGLQQNSSCQPSNICSMTTICKSLVFWHFMKACFWLKLFDDW